MFLSITRLVPDDKKKTKKNSMSDPGTTYRTREEVQRMRSTQDPIRGLQRYIEEWGVATDAELKASNPQHFFFLLQIFLNAHIGHRQDCQGGGRQSR